MDKKDKSKLNPYDNANLLSKFFFCWMAPFVVQLYKTTISADGLKNCPADDDCYNIGPRLESFWNLEEEKTRLQKNGSVWKALLKALGLRRIITYISCAVMLGLWKGGFQVYTLSIFVTTLGNPNSSMELLYLTTSLLSVAVFLIPPLIQFNIFYGMATGNRLSAALSYMIYNKCLRINQEALGETSVGQIITMLSSDVKRLEVVLSTFPILICGLLELLFGAFMLWPYLKEVTLSGILFVFLFFPYWLIVISGLAKRRHNIAKITDERTRLFSDLISGIRVIKMYAWESVFSKIIQTIRKKELKSIWYFSFLRSINNSFSLISDKVIMLVMFGLAIFVVSMPVSLEAVFISFIVLGNAKSSIFIVIPISIEYGANTISAIQRIQKFMSLPEKIPSPALENLKEVVNPRMTFQNLRSKWSTSVDEVDMTNVKMCLNAGEKLIVTGPVGSGKTSFLLTLLGECPLLSGSIDYTGRIAYVPQEAWIVSGSLKENVIMWAEYEESKYRRVLEICALVKDVEQLPDGDQTLVGERGVQLSGGQKARVNLARAVYADLDIYLIDDPLSAVDTHVADHLFRNVIHGFLKDKVCILVTHHIQYLKEATQIIITKKGKVAVSGTYDEVLSYTSVLYHQHHRKSTQGEISLFDEEDENATSRVDVANTQLLLTEDFLRKDEEEDFRTEDVNQNIYSKYMAAAGGGKILFVLLFTAVSCQCLITFTEFWFFMWLPFASTDDDSTIPVNATRPLMNWAFFDVSSYNLLLCIGLFTSAYILSILSMSLWYTSELYASKRMHNNVLNSVLDAPTSFFDSNSDGRILNRVTRDMSVVDEDVPYRFTDSTKFLLWNLASMCVGVLFRVWMIVPIIVFVFLTIAFLFSYKVVSRNMKVVEAAQITTVFSHLTTTLRGLAVIRTFKGENMFLKKFCDLRNVVTSSIFFYVSMIRFTSLALEYMCSAYTLLVIWAAVLFADYEQESRIMPLFAVASSLTISMTFEFSLNLLVEVDAMMVSVERILQYENLPSETKTDAKNYDKIIPESDWPQMGSVIFKDVCLIYSTTAAPALKNVNFHIKAGEKIGIVGRTGAGKSSLVAALFRFAEVEGLITIDDVAITKIGLQHLRSKLSIIPQDPVLFTGTVRTNLDPFLEYPDYKLWNALEEVQLKKATQDFPDGLNHYISEGGLTFSVGERQLFCLARAILRNNTILILDEATANVDLRTDSLIQETIRSKFSKCTVLTIAHRLQTVMDCDRVMVLDEGRVLEFDAPYVLLQRENSKFKAMVYQTGSSSIKLLSNIAWKAYTKKMTCQEAEQ